MAKSIAARLAALEKTITRLVKGKPKKKAKKKAPKRKAAPNRKKAAKRKTRPLPPFPIVPPML